MTAVVSRAVQWTWRACVLLLVLAALSGPALAAKGGNGNGGGGGHGNSGGGGKGGGGGRGAPEIDPGTLASTLTVLTGGALMLADRRRKR